MKTWNDYKEYVKSIDDNNKNMMEEIENISAIISSLVAQRNALGLSQRELAAMCDMPQSSIARIESMKTIPKLDTLLRLMQILGLQLTISQKPVAV